MSNATPLTGIWLKACGFQPELRDPRTKYWKLCLGDATPNRYDTLCSDDLVLEIHEPNRTDDVYWMVFLCRDRNKHVCLGDMTTWGHVQTLIEAITRRPWNRSDVIYGSYLRPGFADKIRRERDEAAERLAREPATNDDIQPGEIG